MQPVTRCLAFILLATDIGLVNHSRPVFQSLETWEIQSIAKCLAWILLAFDIGLRLLLYRTADNAEARLPSGIHFDDAPPNYEMS